MWSDLVDLLNTGPAVFFILHACQIASNAHVFSLFILPCCHKSENEVHLANYEYREP